MSLPILLVTTLACATLTLSASVPNESAEKSTESNVETFDSYSVQNLPPQMPLNIQLPRVEPNIPFYPSQPVPYLRAPQLLPIPKPNFYQVPVPSEFLTAPTEGTWNFNNDPTLYYELPASITKENIPTNQFPKKYMKEIHSKSKPLSAVPKQEIALEPINESEYIQRQKQLFKTVENLNKKENQKGVEQDKVPMRKAKPQKRLRTIKTEQKDSTTLQTKLTKPSKAPPSEPLSQTTYRPVKKDKLKIPADSRNSETTYGQTYDSEPERSSSKKFNRGLAPHITDSLGISSNHGADGGPPERVLFHMVGHDGPMSYKWGYDTGEGNNRQFRYEERDKEGLVKGQFGYYDRDGKFTMMNYHAHPDSGFHMEPAPESEINE